MSRAKSDDNPVCVCEFSLNRPPVLVLLLFLFSMTVFLLKIIQINHLHTSAGCLWWETFWDERCCSFGIRNIQNTQRKKRVGVSVRPEKEGLSGISLKCAVVYVGNLYIICLRFSRYFFNLWVTGIPAFIFTFFEEFFLLFLSVHHSWCRRCSFIFDGGILLSQSVSQIDNRRVR